MLRAVAAVVVVGLVAALALLDHDLFSGDPTSGQADGPATAQPTTGTVAPLPDASVPTDGDADDSGTAPRDGQGQASGQDGGQGQGGDKGKDKGRKRGGGRSAIPVPPADLETIACQHNQRRSRLTVVSFNTHRSYGPDGMDRIAAEIRRARADVVLLQEVDRFWPRTRGVDQAAWFARALGMEYVFGANVVSGRRQYGTVTLTRHPVVDQRSTRLPNAAGGEQRGLLQTVLDVDGREVSVYNTHLQNGMPGLRDRQAWVVAGVVGSDPRPVVLGGDLNAGPSSVAVRHLRTHLRDTWRRVGRGPGATNRGGARIDYLLASDDFTPTGAQVLPSAVSDHHLLRATYTLPAGPECDEGS